MVGAGGPDALRVLVQETANFLVRVWKCVPQTHGSEGWIRHPDQTVSSAMFDISSQLPGADGTATTTRSVLSSTA
jgi:hypothetical protein